jgi:hypothetical protein
MNTGGNSGFGGGEYFAQCHKIGAALTEFVRKETGKVPFVAVTVTMAVARAHACASCALSPPPRRRRAC